MIFKPLEQQTAEDWTHFIGVDQLGAFYFIKQAFLRLERGATIVNVSSIHAVENDPAGFGVCCR